VAQREESKARLAVFVSGAGSNLRALAAHSTGDDAWPARIVAVVSDKPQCAGVAFAREAGISVYAHSPGNFASAREFETGVLGFLQRHGVQYIALAGYMRIIRDVLLEAYAGRILNIHPSLLPAFPGKQGVADAFAAGVDVTGVTVHLVDAGVDTGPILAQERVMIERAAGIEQLYEDIHQVEHRLYADTIARFVRGEFRQQ